jgi:hypothetical protein
MPNRTGVHPGFKRGMLASGPRRRIASRRKDDTLRAYGRRVATDRVGNPAPLRSSGFLHVVARPIDFMAILPALCFVEKKHV